MEVRVLRKEIGCCLGYMRFFQHVEPVSLLVRCPHRAASSRELLLKLVGILLFPQHHRHNIKAGIQASQTGYLRDLVGEFHIISPQIIGMDPIQTSNAVPFLR